MIRPLWRPLSVRHFALLILSALVLNGCAVKGPVPTSKAPTSRQQSPVVAQPDRPKSQAPEQNVPRPLPAPSSEEPAGPAHSLYAQADAALSSGQPDRAEILLERALRIEPGKALYWHALARAKYDQGDYAQAVQFCLKAQSRMQKNSALARYNRELLENAYRQLGDTEKAEKVRQ